MRTITIRELRQHWPRAEAALKLEDEILITRESRPVAKLVRVSPVESKRPRWNVQQHARWQREVCGGTALRSDKALAQSRAERRFAIKGA